MKAYHLCLAETTIQDEDLHKDWLRELTQPFYHCILRWWDTGSGKLKRKQSGEPSFYIRILLLLDQDFTL